MRIGLILVYTMLSVELSIGWLKIRCARMRAHARAHRIFDRCLGAFINTFSSSELACSPFWLMIFVRQFW
jgi:hypothetical protein